MDGRISIDSSSPEEVIEILEEARTEYPEVAFETEGGEGLFATGIEPELIREIVIHGGPPTVFYTWKFISARIDDSDTMEFTHENVDEAAREILESEGGVPREEANLVKRSKNSHWVFEFEDGNGALHRLKLYEQSPRYDYEEIE